MLSVFVSPGELLAVRWHGLRRQIAEKCRRPLTAAPGPAWEDAAQAFSALLPGFPACRRVRVILSSHFTALKLLPWRDDLKDREEELAAARQAFTQTYGETAANWQLRLTDAAPGVPRLAAAVESAFLSALEASASARKVRLDAIQPYFTAVANHWCPRLPRHHSSWLIVHEEGRVTAGLIERDRWRWLRSVRVGADWWQRLPDFLDGEAMLAGIDGAAMPALVFSPALDDISLPGDRPGGIRVLSIAPRQRFSPAVDNRFAPALVG